MSETHSELLRSRMDLLAPGNNNSISPDY